MEKKFKPRITSFYLIKRDLCDENNNFTNKILD